MTTRRLSDDDLKTLRTIADPALEDDKRLGAGYFESVAKSGVVGALTGAAKDRMDVLGTAALARWRRDAPERFGIDDKDLWPNIQKARGLFETYGDEIAAALLLAGLPELYATQWGAPVLVAHGDLVWNVRRRVRQTAQFLLDVLSSQDPKTNEPRKADDLEETDDLANGTRRLVTAALAVRYFHHELRAKLPRDRKVVGVENFDPNKPLNQEDLLGTLLTFTVTVFRVFALFGVELTADEQKAYLLLWDLVGELMGIGDETAEAKAKAGGIDSPLRPSSVAEAFALLEKLHSRQWRPVSRTLNDCDLVLQRDGGAAGDTGKGGTAPRRRGWPPWARGSLPGGAAADTGKTGLLLPSDPLVPGRILMRALLDELTEAMPPRRRRLPLAVVRALAPHDVRTRLGLIGGGLVDYAWNRLPGRRWRTDRWTSFETPNRVGATLLRVAAGDVSRNAIIAFLEADGPPFVFPNLDFGHDGPPKEPSLLVLVRQSVDD